MGRIKYKEAIKNGRLTDYSGVKELVLANTVKNVPKTMKTEKREFDKQLNLFS